MLREVRSHEHELSRYTNCRLHRRVEETGSRRTAASCGDDFEPALSVRGKGEAGANVSFGQIGEVGEDFCRRHVVGDVSDGDAGVPYTGLAAAPAGIDGDDLGVVHALRPLYERFQYRRGLKKAQKRRFSVPKELRRAFRGRRCRR